jgi:hypothetical protein
MVKGRDIVKPDLVMVMEDDFIVKADDNENNKTI